MKITLNWFHWLRKPLTSSVLIFTAFVVTMAACGTTDSPLPVVTVQSLSSQENMTSGDDTLIKVARADGTAFTDMNIFLNNTDVTAKFQKMIIKNSEVKVVSEKFKGKKFVFSGFRNKEWEEYIVENGGEVVGSVSKNTSYLVTTKMDAEQGTTKVTKAKDVGVEIVIKEEFENKFMMSKDMK